MMNTGCISLVLQMDLLNWSINILKQSKMHLFMAVQKKKEKKKKKKKVHSYNDPRSS